MPTWPLQRDCDTYYGNPRAGASWESANLVLVKCPWTLRYDGKPVRGMRVHNLVAPSLRRVLDAIWKRVGQSQSEIDRIGMSVYGGGFNFRKMRGGDALSMHSWGCALDFDPARNGLGDSTPAMDLRVVEEFEREGWEWGGHWRRKDGMHFQAARSAVRPKRLPKAAKVAKAPEPIEPQRFAEEFDEEALTEVSAAKKKTGLTEGSSVVSVASSVDALSTGNTVLEQVNSAKSGLEELGLADKFVLLISNPRFLIALTVALAALGVLGWRLYVKWKR